jgi:hypothetical protein
VTGSTVPCPQIPYQSVSPRGVAFRLERLGISGYTHCVDVVKQAAYQSESLTTCVQTRVCLAMVI